MAESAEMPTKELKLYDLPTVPLEKIFEYINIWHHNRIRATCSRLREKHNTYLMHKFKKMISDANKAEETNQPVRYTNCLVKSRSTATDLYCLMGAHEQFCTLLITLMRECYRKPFEPPITMVSFRLNQFYECVDKVAEERDKPNESKFLYLFTLLNLAKLIDLS